MKSTREIWHIKKANIRQTLAPAFLIVCNIFLFGPTIIYSGNIDEFNVSLINLLKYYAVPALILFLALLAIGMFISKKYIHLYVSILFSVGMLLWLQGNFLLWKYGLLDGQGIDWSRDCWRGWFDGAIWITGLALSCLFFNRISKIAKMASTVIVVLQLLNLLYTGIHNPEILAQKRMQSSVLPPVKIFDFSSTRNVIHIMLDAFQSDLFEDIISSDTNYYRSALDGFTFFRETTGAFATTYMSIPATFSGKYYRNDVPMREFVKRTLNGKTILNTLYDIGYDVHLVHMKRMYAQGRYSSLFFIPLAYGETSRQDEKANAELMMDLVLFRLAPHLLKKVIYNNEAWTIQRLFGDKKGSAFIGLSHKEFLEDLITKMAVRMGKPVYKFIHLVTTHPPVIIDKNCEFAGKALPSTRKNFLVQDKCALDDVIKFLDRLKALNIYDNSIVIVQADTGLGLPVKMRNFGAETEYRCYPSLVGNALPLLLIKPMNSRGPLQISDAQVMLTDIPASIASLLDLNVSFPGFSVFKVNPNTKRVRKYNYYKWRNEHWQSEYLPPITEYIIKGSVFDAFSWEKGQRLLRPLTDGALFTKKIDFGTESAENFLLGGWSVKEKDAKDGLTFQWALGSFATIRFPLPKQKPVVLTAKVRSIKFRQPQRVSIQVDGVMVGVWELGSDWKWEKHSVVIHPNDSRPNVSIVNFIFSQHYEPNEKVKRPLAVLFESITLKEYGTE